MRFIIAAAGEGTRWNNHAGGPKHLIRIGSETLLERTVRLFSPHGECVIVGPYEVPGARTVAPDPVHHLGLLGRLLDSHDHWLADGRTVLLFGDVWYSDAAAEAILTRDWPVFGFAGRFDASTITGKKYGEIFAFWFTDPEWVWERAVALTGYASAFRNLRLWHLYRWLNEADLLNHQRLPGFVEVNDFTDDFDKPEDLDRWLALR